MKGKTAGSLRAPLDGECMFSQERLDFVSVVVCANYTHTLSSVYHLAILLHFPGYPQGQITWKLLFQPKTEKYIVRVLDLNGRIKIIMNSFLINNPSQPKALRSEKFMISTSTKCTEV